MSPSDSTAPGYLQPETGPLEDSDLEDFFHDWIAGLTGLDPTLIRPRWQPEPPNIPKAGTVWVAFGLEDVNSDTYPFVGHNDADDSDTLQRHEEIDILLSFYGLGEGGGARAKAKLLRDNTAITQNLDTLFLAGIALVEVQAPIPVPSLLKERWNYRLDLRIRLRRPVVRKYIVRHLLDGEVELDAEAGENLITRTFDLSEG